MKPKVIAYSKGLTVIPFENVLAVAEDPSVDGQIMVGLSNSSVHVGERSRPHTIVITPDNAQEFIDQYNTYLCTVESLTMTMKFIQEDPEVQP